MLEAHEDHMVFARDVLEQKAKADERFARRFAKIVAINMTATPTEPKR